MNLFKKMFAKPNEDDKNKNGIIRTGDYLVNKDMNIYQIIDMYYIKKEENYYVRDRVKIKELFTQKEETIEMSMETTSKWKHFSTLLQLIEYFENIANTYTVEYTNLNEMISKIKVLRDNL